MAFTIKRKPFNRQSAQYDAVTASEEVGTTNNSNDTVIAPGNHPENNAPPTNLFHSNDFQREIELNIFPKKSSQPSLTEHELLLSPAISDLSGTIPRDARASTISANSVLYQKQNDGNLRAEPPDSSQGNPPIKPEHAPWGIHWYQPAFILAMLLCGLVFSLSHHFYYKSMDGSTAGDAAKQAWPIRFGTAFAFLVVACLRATTASALAQYTWTVVRRKPLKISSLDKLFGMTGNPRHLFSLELLKSARIVILFGVVYWLLGIAGVAPPATLTVRAKNLTDQAFIPMLNYSLPSWDVSPGVWEAGAVTNRIALQSTFSFDVVPLPRVVSSQDWSYDLQFVGPTLQCRDANETEQPYFDQITGDFESQDAIFVYSQVNDSYWNAAENGTGPTRLIYSAWTSLGMPNGSANAWYPACGGSHDFCKKNDWTELGITSEDHVVLLYPQFWVQTADSSIVCTSVNATFDITVASVSGAQQITQRNVQVIGNGSYPFIETGEYVTGLEIDNGVSEQYDNTEPFFWSVYTSHVYAMGTILQGNITLVDLFYDNEDINYDYFNETGTLSGTFTNSGFHYAFGNTTTNVLESGLIACDEIFNSPFKYLHSPENPNELNSGNATEEEMVVFNNTFPIVPGMCRNGSLLRAIEDLANNVTISMLSSSDLTSLDPTPRSLTTSNTINVYQYNPRLLFISYGIALLLTLIATAVGLYSLHLNGVSHSGSFSSIVATTRNSDLDSLTNSSSLGALPFRTNIEQTRLKFGPLLDRTEMQMRNSAYGGHGPEVHDPPHIAFGLEGTVGQLRKGEPYS